MHRLAVLVAAALALPACLDLDPSASYDVRVDWSTTNPASESVVTHVTYDGETIETHGSLDSHGYAGTARVSGETYESTIEICVELGNYAWVDQQTGWGCESGDGECDPPVHEFVPTRVQCANVAPDATHVQMTF